MGITEELILYRQLEYERLFENFTGLLEEGMPSIPEKAGNISKKGTDTGLYYQCLHELVELAASHGFEGNLWHNFLAFLLVNHENAYTKACEIGGTAGETLQKAALHDFRIFRKLFAFDLSALKLGDMAAPEIDFIVDYRCMSGAGTMFNRRIRDMICALAVELGQAKTAEEFQEIITRFYRNFGVGRFGLHKAFRIEHGETDIVIAPISNIAHVKLADLVGYEIAKKKLTDNTEAFVSGRQANNCLLYGDAGTGKSSSIKAIANQYYDRGLRIIEVYKHQFQDLHDVIAQIKDRGYKFILYMDDLSFEDFEIEYKYLKAVIEGGLEKKPDNILIYATSNRRHLIREKFSDKAELSDDLHNNDTVQEKLSLAARFGMQIYFGAPDKKEYLQIVKALAEQHSITLREEELFAQAGRWELNHGGRSGRTAQQFINDLMGKKQD